MINTSIDRATGFLIRRYILSYWLPIFVALSIIFLLNNLLWGSDSTQIWWENIQCLLLSEQQCLSHIQLDIIVYLITGITIFAYLLQIFTNHVVRLFEGYWDFFPLNTLAILLIKRNQVSNKIINDNLVAAIDSENVGLQNYIQQKIDNEYPNNDDLILPTKLGNVIRSAELHSYDCYGMDSVFWWPRLWQVLPQHIKNDINDSLTPLLALLNFSILIPLFALTSLVYTFYQRVDLFSDFWITLLKCLITLIFGVILAWITYRAAISQAIIYGSFVKSAIDVYRLDLISALHQPLPKNISEESKLWDDLLKWLYTKDRISAPDYFIECKTER